MIEQYTLWQRNSIDNTIEIYKTNTGTEINVKLEGDTIWFSERKMVKLFDKDVRIVNEHIKNIYDTQEIYKYQLS
ncbi:hypothetical protein [Plebeiibacterium sediminum]|uniref:Uncharacterized protein n=1 Tax=Plebeiibacterium sediminum TaxID=2992112 RepID=A0AAE3M9Y8_9BACT|nr:hypothetical protein [Plebeiobacterium sediminum]MCW3789545.1 hypothetical protein [Plebeiobacterium sediminum]